MCTGVDDDQDTQNDEKRPDDRRKHRTDATGGSDEFKHGFFLLAASELNPQNDVPEGK
jgi:hypothetical protein